MTSHVCASVAIRFLERIILSLIALELPCAKPVPYRHRLQRSDRCQILPASETDRLVQCHEPRRLAAQADACPRIHRVLEIRDSNLVQGQAVACSKNQVIEGTKVCEKALHSLFVRDVNRLSLCFCSDRFKQLPELVLRCWKR